MATAKKRLAHIAPLRAGLVFGVLGGMYALILSVIATAIMLLPDDIPIRVKEAEIAGWMFVIAVGVNALVGMAIGVGGAVIYNLLAEWMGGLEISLCDAGDGK